jgi:phosphohistidine swiveling domain-containing protein
LQRAGALTGYGEKLFFLGIPVVVGCGNATMHLHTGDWLRVNGELSTIERLGVTDAVQPLA